jgi:hypothetical protein
MDGRRAASILVAGPLWLAAAVVGNTAGDPMPGMRVVAPAGPHRVKNDPELIATLLDELGLGSDPRARAQAEMRTQVHEPSTQPERGE